MDNQTKVLVVDDDSFMRDIFAMTLSDSYTFLSAENGEEALKLAEAKCPNLIILDVEMPNMDGYELCRRLKENANTSGAPIIFVSAHDQIEERLKGYEAGGEDYIIKPFDPQELKAKVAQLLKIVSERARLKEMASYASSTAMTAITSLGEIGALLASLKNFNASTDEKTLAEAVLSGLKPFELRGVVQIRTQEKKVSISAQGEASPLEISVIDNMSVMDRITHFKSRMSINYPHVSILVNNMPTDDPDRCGRLRDHLAMLVEGAEMKASEIIAENESRQRGEAIEHAAISVTKMLAEVDHAQRQSKLSTSMAVYEFTEELGKAYVRIALTDEQERFMADIIKTGLGKIADTHSEEIDIQNNLTKIINELKSIIK